MTSLNSNATTPATQPAFIYISDILSAIKRQQAQPRSRVPGGGIARRPDGDEIIFGYIIEPGGFAHRLKLRMRYTVPNAAWGPAPIDDVLHLLATTPGFGGKRWWLTCPVCMGRKAKLGLLENRGQFMCKRCLDAAREE